MNRSLMKKYPPYEGDEPFVFLCFADADGAKLEPLMDRLWKRGCRVWYAGNSKSINDEKAAQSRMKEASLVVAYCSEVFLSSPAKSRMMFLQAKNIPVIVIDAKPVDNLSAGLREGTVHINAFSGIDESTETELITSEGFSQDLIGERKEEGVPRGVKAVFRILLALTAAALLIFALMLSGVISPVKNEEHAAEITELSLKVLPQDPNELEKYPNLEKIIIPQAEAENALPYLDKYTVVIRGES